jgi:hypothetical protein
LARAALITIFSLLYAEAISVELSGESALVIGWNPKMQIIIRKMLFFIIS